MNTIEDKQILKPQACFLKLMDIIQELHYTRSTKEVFKKLPVVFVAIGFLIILAYSGQIGYMPIFDLSSFTTVLIAVAVAAIFFTLLTAFVLILPGSYWRFLIGRENQLMASIRGLGGQVA